MQLTKYNSDQMSLHGSRVVSRILAGIDRIGATISLWRSRQRERRALMKLDDRFLRDIGVTRSQAVEEAGKPFWSGPPR